MNMSTQTRAKISVSACVQFSRSTIDKLRFLSLALLLAMLGLLAVPIVHAAGIVGTGTPASCTEATLDAALVGGGTVTFNCGGGAVSITVTSTKSIASNTTIDGGGLVSISGGNAVRVFVVNSGVTFNLQNISVVNGKENTGAGGGGAIFNSGVANISSVAFSNNRSSSIGAVGGAISNIGTLNITNSTFSGNVGNGGGIFNTGTAIIDSTTFSNNSALDGGGAITNRGSITVSNSTFSTNTANVGGSEGGGAIHNQNADMTITNSTFNGNSVSAGLGGIGAGSIMIRSSLGTLMTITNSTIYGNTGSGGGTPPGGINVNGPSNTTIRNSIVANNSFRNCPSSIINGGNNIEDSSDCGWGFASGSMSNTDPMVNALANNGGPTQTMALSVGSPAINAGNPAFCPATDQRGVSRVGDCDIGAYESPFVSSPTTTNVSSSLNPSIFGQAVTFTASVNESVPGTPTGTVTFRDGATTIGTGILNASAQATFATSTLAVGTHSITGVYEGDGSFNSSTSPALVQTVNVLTATPTPTNTPTQTATAVPTGNDEKEKEKDKDKKESDSPPSRLLPGQSIDNLNSRELTVTNRFTGTRVTIPANTAQPGWTISIRPVSPNEASNLSSHLFTLAGLTVEIIIRDGNGNIVSDFSGSPLTVCIPFTDSDLSNVGGDSNKLQIIRNPGKSDEQIISTGRTVDFSTHLICVTTTRLSVWGQAKAQPTPLPAPKASTPARIVRSAPSATPTAPATLIAKALTVPTLAPTALLNSSAKGQTQMALGSKGGTIRNSDMGAQVTFATGALPDDSVVIVQVSKGLSQTTTNGFELLGEPFEVVVMNGNRNTPISISKHPMRLCLDYTDEQLAHAGGDVSNLVILQNPGTLEEIEATRAKTFGTRRVCVDVEDASTFALAARVTNREEQIILAQGLANILSLTLFGGSAILAVVAFGLRTGWLRR